MKKKKQRRSRERLVRLSVVREIAHEAHIMGRVYQNGGEIRGPAEEWGRVDQMVDRKLAAKRLRRTR